MKKAKIRGFHLIEILITLGIIALVAAISLPTYTHYITQTQRIAAGVKLSGLAMALENYHFEYHTFQGVTLNKLNIATFIVKNNYKLQIQQADSTHFKIAAIPQGKQAERDKRCGSLILNEQQQKSTSGIAKVDECW